jgi:hypothetical protein
METMSEIEPGEGWRLLGPDEVIRKGDEVYTGSGWFVTVDMGLVVAEYTYRRRIPAKPKAIWIDGHRVSFTEGSVHIGNKAYDYCFSSHTEDIRKLGEWCISMADWREAQEAGK